MNNKSDKQRIEQLEKNQKYLLEKVVKCDRILTIFEQLKEAFNYG